MMTGETVKITCQPATAVVASPPPMPETGAQEPANQ